MQHARQLTVQRPETLAFVTQTTLSVDDTQAIVDALRERFPELQAPRVEDICYATQNRQDAVKKLLTECDVLVVVGSSTSSNSNRLRELADRAGIPGYLVDGPQNLQREWFVNRNAVGVTAGASAPELLVQQVVDQLTAWGGAGAAADGRARRKRGVQPAEVAAARGRARLNCTSASTFPYCRRRWHLLPPAVPFHRSEACAGMVLGLPPLGQRAEPSRCSAGHRRWC